MSRWTGQKNEILRLAAAHLSQANLKLGRLVKVIYPLVNELAEDGIQGQG